MAAGSWDWHRSGEEKTSPLSEVATFQKPRKILAKWDV